MGYFPKHYIKTNLYTNGDEFVYSELIFKLALLVFGLGILPSPTPRHGSDALLQDGQVLLVDDHAKPTSVTDSA